MEKQITKYNKHYTVKGRNGWTPTSTEDNLTDNRVPSYYKGKDGYEARKVCDNFNLSYHCATATTYILRAYRKHDSPVECLSKAIAHLQFELEKIQREND
jgi:hypothetical protein|tara:strand:+ start:2305 stop:2604 length:300 start_codon:yes stop_codon:yes gene_type:complete